MTPTALEPQRIDFPNVAVWWVQVPTHNRDAETAAVAKLVRAAFGEDAIKSNTPEGVPYIILADGTHRDCSISHCATLAALAVPSDGFTVGIDVECNTRQNQLQRVAQRAFSTEEIEEYSNSLVAAWTMKEAIYKAALTPGLDLRTDVKIPRCGISPSAAGKPMRTFTTHLLNTTLTIATTPKGNN